MSINNREKSKEKGEGSSLEIDILNEIINYQEQVATVLGVNKIYESRIEGDYIYIYNSKLIPNGKWKYDINNSKIHTLQYGSNTGCLINQESENGNYKRIYIPKKNIYLWVYYDDDLCEYIELTYEGNNISEAIIWNNEKLITLKTEDGFKTFNLTNGDIINIDNGSNNNLNGENSNNLSFYSLNNNNDLKNIELPPDIFGINFIDGKTKSITFSFERNGKILKGYAFLKDNKYIPITQNGEYFDISGIDISEIEKGIISKLSDKNCEIVIKYSKINGIIENIPEEKEYNHHKYGKVDITKLYNYSKLVEYSYKGRIYKGIREGETIYDISYNGINIDNLFAIEYIELLCIGKKALHIGNRGKLEEIKLFGESAEIKIWKGKTCLFLGDIYYGFIPVEINNGEVRVYNGNIVFESGKDENGEYVIIYDFEFEEISYMNSREFIYTGKKVHDIEKSKKKLYI